MLPGGVPVWNPLMQARKWAMCWEGSILLTLGKKTYRIQKGETFYFPAGQEHWLEAGKMGCYDPVDLLPAKFLMIKRR